jgi:hydrogenase expression/formation protein HypC
MCLGIPGEIVEIQADQPHLAKVDVKGVKRLINIGLLDEDPPKPGEWILIHLGFALSKIDKAEAESAMEFLEDVGEPYQALEAEIAALREQAVE